MVEKTYTVEETLQRLISKISRKKKVVLTPSSTFRELGADSLDVVQILVSLEDIFGIDLVDAEMKSISSMKDFIDYVQKKVDEKKKLEKRGEL
jgi:acyl carrier protein